MKLKTQLSIVLIILLAACGAEKPASPTLAPEPTATTAPTLPPPPTHTPEPALSPTDPAVATIELTCADWESVTSGSYRAENNTWGKGDLTGWSQCIGLSLRADGALAARWTWDWLMAGGSVKAYPEIVFGQKPGSQSTTPDLPLQVSRVKSAQVTYDITSTRTGSGNLAFDIWLTDSANPDTWGAPPITHEIMIWLEGYGSLAPGGSWVETVPIGDADYSVYLARNWGDGWTYIAFYRTPNQLGAGTLELADFLAYMLENELATGAEYMASIEIGNEVVSGSGETILNQYEVSVQSK